MPFSIGETVGPYRIVEKLGQGGMATVFKAYHPALDRYVAIKVLHPAFQEDPHFLARFQREARIVAKLDHPNIVPVYDFAEHRGHPYLVMRFIEGETLKARLRRGPLSLEEVWRVMRAVGDALSYAHRQGVLHRDIKPSNIILTPDGHVYLTDFGLARMAQAGESTLSRDMMVGTPQYISPEQAKGETNLDARTDIYSLGVVLYELLVGRVPFQADTPYAVIHDHIFTPLPLPRKINPDLPEPLERVLLKALAKDPDDRFQSVEEMMQAFEEALGTASTVASALPETVIAPRPTEALPEKAKARRRWWVWVLAGLGGLLCLVGLLAVLSGGWGGIEPGVSTVPPGTTSTALPPSPEATVPTGQPSGQRLLEEAHAARNNREIIRALALYRRAIEADPHLEAAYLEQGDLLVMLGEIDRALQNYVDGVNANPDSLALRQQLAETAALLGATEILHDQVDWLVQNAPDDPLIPAANGMLAFYETSCLEALPQFDQALQADPAQPLALFGRGLCQLFEGNAEGAQESLQAVLYRQRTGPLLQAIAEVWLTVIERGPMGAVEQGVADLQSAIERIPPEQKDLRDTLSSHVDRAMNEWKAGRSEKAVQELRGARVELIGKWDTLEERLILDIARSLTRLMYMMDVLSPDMASLETSTGQVWESLRTLAADVPEEGNLRNEYKTMVDQIIVTWQQGDVEGAIEVAKGLIDWAEQHREALGDPLTERIVTSTDEAIHWMKGQ
ncbi:MAG TPA: serine/threonine-protein kinase [Chloroflexi bacterium]|nr:serine/threonine-protein kinase [Chloroflexota bacterium]